MENGNDVDSFVNCYNYFRKGFDNISWSSIRFQVLGAYFNMFNFYKHTEMQIITPF